MPTFSDSMIAELRGVLSDGLQGLNLALDPAAQEQLLELIALLAKWNTAYNLTAIREPRDMVIKHLLDSLAARSAIDGARVLDVGTGGGFPGLPLAIISREQQFALLDASQKKIRFVNRAIDTLGLSNASAVHARVEDYVEAGFDTVTCRAFSSLPNIVAWTEHLLAPGGAIVAMKGQPVAAEELAALGSGWRAEQRPVVVPLLAGERHLVTLTRSSDAPIR